MSSKHRCKDGIASGWYPGGCMLTRQCGCSSTGRHLHGYRVHNPCSSSSNCDPGFWGTMPIRWAVSRIRRARFSAANSSKSWSSAASLTRLVRGLPAGRMNMSPRRNSFTSSGLFFLHTHGVSSNSRTWIARNPCRCGRLHELCQSLLEATRTC